MPGAETDSSCMGLMAVAECTHSWHQRNARIVTVRCQGMWGEKVVQAPEAI